MDLGQHLLCDPAVIARVVKAAALVPGDHVLDAGAGRGALTEPIAAMVGGTGHAWAVDVDPGMARHLRAKKIPQVSVVEADLLTWPLPDSLTAVVANPPYKIAAPLIERLAAAGIQRCVYVVPRELADRLSAAPGSKHYGKLTVRVALHADVQDLGYLSRKAFDPQPTVTSGIIRLRARPAPHHEGPMLDAVLDAAWLAWDRKSRHAFGTLAHDLRTDGGSLARLLKDAGWSEVKTGHLPPDAFAAVANHLSSQVRQQT